MNPLLLYLSWCSQPKPDADKYWWALHMVLLPFTLLMILLQLAWEKIADA